ncbi:10146_t:CDS:1 [Paraglomus brasilianum]|uniref:10146_t:CDS:1 n=1 Tax=Paraglomus brasilianum TaxID=144538 RepID=A0A9N8ZK14_9GLOM|nr:10146_t:CDS:1 [Paraglomus brasilianum]
MILRRPLSRLVKTSTQQIRTGHSSVVALGKACRAETTQKELWKNYLAVLEDCRLDELDRPTVRQFLRKLSGLDDVGQRAAKTTKVLKDLAEIGFRAHQVERNYLIEAYLRANKLAEAREIFDRIHSLRPPLGKEYCPFCPAFNMMIEAYGNRGDLEEARKLYQCMFEKGVKPNAKTRLIITAIFKKNLSPTTLEWFRGLMESRLIDDGTGKEGIIVLTDAGNLDGALELYNKLKSLGYQMDAHVYARLISLLTRYGRLVEAIDLVKELKASGVELDTVAYNVIIRVYIRSNEPEQAIKVIDEMIEAKVYPVLRSFVIMVDAFANEGQIKPALITLKKMRDLGVKPDVYLYTCLIKLFANVNDIDAMEKMFRHMIEEDFDPNLITYTILMTAYCRNYDIEKAILVSNAMLKAGIIPDARLFNALISVCGERADSDGAMMLLDDMKMRNIPPDVYTYTSIIKAFVKATDIYGAERVLQSMITSGIKPEAMTYNILLDYFVEQRDVKQVRQIYEEMLYADVRPDINTYGCLMQSFCSIGDFKAAFELLTHMENVNVKPDVQIYTILINAYMRRRDFVAAERIYETIISKGFLPTYFTYAVLIDGHARKGDFGFARKLLDELIAHSELESQASELVRHKAFPQYLFTPIMDAYAKQAQSDGAREIFEEMVLLGVRPNEYVYTILMDGYRRGGNYEAVWQMWKILLGEFGDKSLLSTKIVLPTRPVKGDPETAERSRMGFEKILPQIASFSPKSRKIPLHSLSILLETLTAAGRYDLIEQEWQRLHSQGFEFDAHNYNHYAQSLIASGNILKACVIIKDHLIKGWDSRLAHWRRTATGTHFEKRQQKAKLIEQSTSLYPHRKTLMMLKKVFDQLRNGEWDSLNVGIDQKPGNELWTHITEHYSDIVASVEEMNEFTEWERRDQTMYEHTRRSV